MIYKLKLVDSKSGKIEINDEDNIKNITAIKFNLRQDERLASERATDISPYIEITGKIDNETSQEQTRLLLEWAQETKDLDIVYKHIVIEIWKGTNDLARKYELDNIYCVDYYEEFLNDNSCNFKLKLAQRKGFLGSIKFSSK